MAQHVPRVGPANRYLGDAVVRPRGDAPFLCGTLCVLGRVVGLPDVGLKGILGEVVIARANIGIAELIAHAPEGPIVVAGGVFIVVDNLDAVLVAKVEEVFLLVADYERDVIDTGGLELLDLALDEDLTAHLEEALRLFVGDGGKAGGEASGEDDGVLNPVGGEGVHAGVGKAAVSDEAACNKGLERGVYCAERDT